MKLLRYLAFVLACAFAIGSVSAADKIGVVLMHGKSPGNANDPNLRSITGDMQQAGMVVLVPDMPWSRSRYLEGNWDLVMSEIGRHIQTLKSQGATKIVLAGHSMGCPAAMSYAANREGVDAVVLLAPGHSPYLYYQGIPQAPFRSWVVKESIDKARGMVAEGKGDEANVSFSDINQGRTQTIWTTPKNFLSYFEPESDAEMRVTAPKLPKHIPVLWVIGDGDSLIKLGKDYAFNLFPPNQHTKYLEVSANHLSTPTKASEQTISWIQKTLGITPVTRD